MAKRKKTSNASAILDQRFGDGPERRAEIDQIKSDMELGQKIYEARKSCGMTQQDLADSIGTTQSVISDLESAEYQGHSMPMLRRIAQALGKTVQVAFVEAEYAA